MKLAACYTVFDGLEMLHGAMKSVAPFVDEFIILYQTVSNHGEVDNSVWDQLQFITSKFTNVHCVFYQTDLSLMDKLNELNKHNLGLKKAKELNCTHFFFAACDHYYLPYEFQKAKQISQYCDLTLTGMFTYYKYPEWQLTPMEDYYMPFICKLYPHTEFVWGVWKLPYLVDPSVRINTTQKHYLFEESEIMLHHYSMVRTDLEKKFRNAAGSKRWGDKIDIFISEYNNYSLNENVGVSYFQGRKIKVVPNYFDI